MAPKFKLNFSVSVNSIECRSSDHKFNLCASQAKRKQKNSEGAHNQVGAFSLELCARRDSISAWRHGHLSVE